MADIRKVVINRIIHAMDKVVCDHVPADVNACDDCIASMAVDALEHFDGITFVYIAEADRDRELLELRAELRQRTSDLIMAEMKLETKAQRGMEWKNG